jgi:hypothetical protein
LPIYYCISENYKGKKKVFLGNTHLYLIPIPEGRYLCLGMLGNFVGSDNCYSCRLIVNMEETLIASVLAGEGEELGERFQVIETLNCQPSPAEEGGYFIELLDKGKYIQSDLIVRLNDKHKNKLQNMYLMAGKLSFLSEPVSVKESSKGE